MKTKQIVIIGAGVAGLVAAIHCEAAGFSPLIVEADKTIGGRTQSVEKDKFILDKGFQVLLTEYTSVKKYLDIPSLHLKYFSPGAFIFSAKKEYEISDPFREWWNLPQMIFSGVGTLKDKWLIFKLSQSLKNKQEDTIFDGNKETTLHFLKAYGFSDRIIDLFFRPFFSGIFLEDRLETPATMFKFVFGKFSKGRAAIPEKGIQEIPIQLLNKLKDTTILLDTRVERVDRQLLILENGEILPFEKLIIATDYRLLFKEEFPQPKYNHHIQYYFKTDRPLLGKKIGLIADPDAGFLTVAAIGELKGIKKPTEGYLLSVTLKAETINDQVAAFKLMDDLRKYFHMPSLPLTFLGLNYIKNALPVCSELFFNRPLSDFQYAENIFLAGDYLLNPSLDAAMRSGEMAVKALLSQER
jgi:protoporphyrinogen oxidase